jgi:cysteine-rich repeat protein
MHRSTTRHPAWLSVLAVLSLSFSACGVSESTAGLTGFTPDLPSDPDVVGDVTPGDGQGPDEPAPVTCSGDADCEDPWPCTSDRCDDGVCRPLMVLGTCLLDGVCLEEGTAQWGNACKVCAPLQSTDTWTPLDEGPCDDGDPCTRDDQCVAGACQAGDPDPCDDGDPCTVDACVAGQGCTHVGECACETDADCAGLDDGDLCNGRLACLPAGPAPDVAHACVPDPDSVVTCDTSQDTACLKTTCLPASGACVTAAVLEPGVCDDGDPCTVGDACHGGACSGSPCEAVGRACRPEGCALPQCGDGWLYGPETCDDENPSPGDGCAPDCRVEDGWTCAGEPSTCTPVPADALTYTFDGDDGSFSGTDGWESQYCADDWTTADNGGVFPNTDDGCDVAENQCTAAYSCGFDWGYWVDWGYCQHSDPFDNHLTWGEKTWTDYAFSVRFKNDDDDAIGVVFRYWNSGQFYLLYFSRDQAPREWTGCNMTYVGARLVRIFDQQSTLLATSDVTYTVGQVHTLRVSVSGAHITAHFDANADGVLDAEPLFDLDDDEALDRGRVGLWAYENGATGDSNDVCSYGGCWFDDVVVELP